MHSVVGACPSKRAGRVGRATAPNPRRRDDGVAQATSRSANDGGGDGALAAARLWDYVAAEGVLGQYRGVTTLEVDRVAILAHGEPLEPRRLSLAELNAEPERFEGRPVLVEGRPRTLDEVFADDDGLLTLLLAATLVLGLSVASVQITAHVRKRHGRIPGALRVEREWIRTQRSSLRARQAVFPGSGPDPSVLEVRPEAAHVSHLTAALTQRVNDALTVILGNLEHLSHQRTGQGTRHAVRDAMDAGERVRATMEDLGYLLPSPVFSPRLTAVDAVCAGVAAQVSEDREGAVSIVTFLHASRAVLADPERLRRVLLHLVRNAFEAMSGGGSLVIRTDETEVCSGEVPGLEPGTFVVIEVSDSGPGMDPVTLRRATEPFFTTHGDRLAMGLGLFVADRFARLSGGALVLESAPGHGTHARLYLPTPTPRLHP